MSMSKAKHVGVDGCPYGWFSVGFDDCDHYELKRFKYFKDVVAYYSRACRILVDIPIGLPSKKPSYRDADLEAQRLLESRKTSVFAVPTRKLAGEAAYAYESESRDKHYKQVNAKLPKGNKVSKQSYNIWQKINEVDEFRLSTSTNTEIREVHPEVCFWALAKMLPARSRKKHSINYSKRDGTGFLERIRLMRYFEPRVERICLEAREKYNVMKHLGGDDILDALVAALTAKLSCQEGYKLKTLPECPPTDCKGLPMEMVYVQA